MREMPHRGLACLGCAGAPAAPPTERGDAAAPRPEQRYSATQKKSCQVQVKFVDRNFDGRVYVTGEGDELGNWRIQQKTLLKENQKTNSWDTDILQLDHSHGSYAYKLVWVCMHNQHHWSEGPNSFIHVDAQTPGSQCIRPSSGLTFPRSCHRCRAPTLMEFPSTSTLPCESRTDEQAPSKPVEFDQRTQDAFTKAFREMKDELNERWLQETLQFSLDIRDFKAKCARIPTLQEDVEKIKAGEHVEMLKCQLECTLNAKLSEDTMKLKEEAMSELMAMHWKAVEELKTENANLRNTVREEMTGYIESSLRDFKLLVREEMRKKADDHHQAISQNMQIDMNQKIATLKKELHTEIHGELSREIFDEGKPINESSESKSIWQKLTDRFKIFGNSVEQDIKQMVEKHSAEVNEEISRLRDDNAKIKKMEKEFTIFRNELSDIRPLAINAVDCEKCNELVRSALQEHLGPPTGPSTHVMELEGAGEEASSLVSSRGGTPRASEVSPSVTAPPPAHREEDNFKASTTRAAADAHRVHAPPPSTSAGLPWTSQSSEARCMQSNKNSSGWLQEGGTGACLAAGIQEAPATPPTQGCTTSGQGVVNVDGPNPSVAQDGASTNINDRQKFYNARSAPIPCGANATRVEVAVQGASVGGDGDRHPGGHTRVYTGGGPQPRHNFNNIKLPEDAKSKDLVLKVDKELYDLKKEGRTREEKQKYLKKVFLSIHPDKGGSEEAVKWFNDWKACWQTWFMD